MLNDKHFAEIVLESDIIAINLYYQSQPCDLRIPLLWGVELHYNIKIQTNNMQLILASAKIMRSADRGRVPTMTTPIFDDAARHLALELSQWSVTDLAKALHCSAAIALENHQRFQQFMVDESSIPAILAYYGQAYKHLRADEFSADDLRFAQNHLLILSFLYGILRPLDGIRLYRLEGKVKLQTTDGKTLFAWWRERLTDCLIDRVKADDGILLHLATEEFEHLFDWKRVEKEVRVVKPYFYVDQGAQFKIVSMYAKGCRGGMARFVIQNKLNDPKALSAFSEDGFIFNPRLGDENHPHFIKA